MRNTNQFFAPSKCMNKKTKNQVSHRAPTVTSKLPTDLLSCYGRPNFSLKLKTIYLINTLKTTKATD